MILQYVWFLNSKKYVVTICLVSQGDRHRDPE